MKLEITVRAETASPCLAPYPTGRKSPERGDLAVSFCPKNRQRRDLISRIIRRRPRSREECWAAFCEKMQGGEGKAGSKCGCRIPFPGKEHSSSVTQMSSNSESSNCRLRSTYTSSVPRHLANSTSGNFGI